ncbi:MAG: hypothetical protein HGA98_05465, partial [Deltaproteobacteria bacterium]|nr:hypothetical protein [Deltaproteobacteria bacterium]
MLAGRGRRARVPARELHARGAGADLPARQAEARHHDRDREPGVRREGRQELSASAGPRLSPGEDGQREAREVLPEGSGSDAATSKGTVVIGTVRGDIHDIGKDIVVLMLGMGGYTVHDLGIDVPAEDFVAAVREHDADVVALSGLLTLAFDAMKSTVDAIAAAGLRDKVRIMIGGAAVDEHVRAYT